MNAAMQPRGVDFHCHLDLYPDYHAAVARAETSRIYTVTVTTTPRAWPHNRDIAAETSYVQAALGLHPQLAGRHADELSLWKSYLPHARFVGEVGLDAGQRFRQSLDLQKQVFQAVLECCAEAGGKLLTVHSVRSAPAVLDMIENYLPRGRGTVVLHWFTGSLTDARRAVELGCYFSVNAAMTSTAKGRALVKELPLQRILTETDGPFITSNNQRPAEPADSLFAIESIAAIRAKPPQEIFRAVLTNLNALLHQPDPSPGDPWPPQ
jgi:TatD DNase family protein